jgi:predicted RNase H-like HicB family nuclease
MKKCFTLEYWIDEDWYVGKLKEVPGVFSQGQTLDELEENIKDTYKLMLSDEDFIPVKDILKKEVEIHV